MKKCPYCGKENHDEAEVCERCFAGFPHDDEKHENASDESVRSRKRKRSE